jgi:hypothetical protein
MLDLAKVNLTELGKGWMVMQPLFGEIRQLGFVSRNIDQSIRHFLTHWNIGPWYVVRNITAPSLYKGEPSVPEISLALSSCGDLQFEIIEQHNDAPSAYREALATSPGLHVQHVAVWTDHFAKIKADALAKGWVAVLETPSGPGQSCYLVHPSEPLVCVEVSDRSPFKEHVREAVRNVANTWDGADPIREGLPE